MINTDAQYRLGNFGWETEKPNQAHAIEWWQKAADQGHLKAQYNLGIVYRKAQDNKNALQCFETVAKHTDKGNPLVVSAQYLLGIMYKKGEGCSQNYQKAREWLKQATGFEKGKSFPENNIQEELITIVQISAQEALEDIAKFKEQEKAKQKLEKANQELENLMGLIAHKFRGSIQVLSYNAQNENQPSISLDSLDTMRGLFEIFSIISTSSENLREKLIQDREGEGTILTTLEKSLSLALTDLLTESNRNKILQHYLAYAKRNKSVDASVTPRQWARERDYLALWKQLQTQWQDTFMNSSKKFDWIKAHLFSLEIAIFDDNLIHFERYGVTESILVIAMTEIISNAIKYYNVQENTVLKLRWENKPDFGIFSCENPYSENESQLDKGSSKGQIFVKNIALKLGGHFSTSVSQNHYTTEFKIPTYLLRRNYEPIFMG
jgi:signal transduction histidine kinase